MELGNPGFLIVFDCKLPESQEYSEQGNELNKSYIKENLEEQNRHCGEM